MYDAWAAYDANAIATTGTNIQKPAAEKTKTNLREAMSFAAYRVLADLFPDQQQLFAQQMQDLGLDAHNNTEDTTTAERMRNAATDRLTMQVSVYSEAAYDNLIGFYRTNENGDVLDQQSRAVAAATIFASWVRMCLLLQIWRVGAIATLTT